MPKEYALYKGDDLLAIGTIGELAKLKGVRENTIRFYSTPSYQRRASENKNNRMIVVKLEDGE